MSNISIYKHALCICALLLVVSQAVGQKSFKINTTTHDYGVVDSASSLLSKFIITNTGKATLYILRAEAPISMKVSSHKRKLSPGDTTAITIVYIPEPNHQFKEKIELYHSSANIPIQLFLSGKVKYIINTENPLTACFTFSGQYVKPKVHETVVQQGGEIETEQLADDAPPTKQREDPVKTDTTISEPELVEVIVEKGPLAQIYDMPLSDFKPNNIVFLVDISGSMKDSIKLPLLKVATTRLLRSLREIDQVSLITYSNEANLVMEPTSCKHKEKIIDEVGSLKAGGLTAGSQGIDLAYQTIQESYVSGANNVIILITDGAFNLSPSNRKLFESESETIYMSVVGIGELGKLSRKVLQKISFQTKGRLTLIKNEKQAKRSLLNEVQRGSAL